MNNLLRQLLRKPTRYIVNITFVDNDNTVKTNRLEFHPIVWQKVEQMFLQIDCVVTKEY
jgi:hypothetical protein